MALVAKGVEQMFSRIAFASVATRVGLAGVIALALMGVSTGWSQTSLIDFESLPGGQTPARGIRITNQFADPTDGGVIFSIDGADPHDPNDALYLGDYGGPRDGWRSDFGNDMLAPGLDFGDFFLAHPDAGRGATTVRDVLIDYVNATEQLGFYLMDLDYTESWTISIYDGNLNLIESRDYDSSVGGDAQATHVTFDQSGGTPISRIRVHWNGTPEGGIGFGFDDFTPATLPEPGSLVLLAGGALAVFRRSR